MEQNEKEINNRYLFEKQKETMQILLSKGAITKEQYEYSLHCLEEKMKIN